MPGYNIVKTQKALPIGCTQPWGGNLSEIPSGWLLCNNQELNASDYPLLARVLRDTYGGTNFDGDFPNYSGTFRLPPMNDKACADISTGYFGLYAGANADAWSAGKTVYDGDLIINSGTYYIVALTISGATSGTLGTTAPSHTTGTVSNSTSVNLVAQTAVPGAVPSPIDNSSALNVVSDFIGDSVGGFEPGDLGPPNVQNATTDITLTYVPDPSGTIVNVSFEGTPPTVSLSQVYTIAEGQYSADASVVGTGAAFTVVVNTDSTYSVAVKQKGQNYEVGDEITINGSNLGGNSTNNLTITVSAIGDQYFEGTIEGQTLIKGFSIKDVYIIPRKLGRNHQPQHYHEGLYPTTNYNDAGDRPGAGACIFANPQMTFADWGERLNPCPPNQPDILCPIPSYDISIKCSEAGVYMGSSKSSIQNMSGSPFTAGPGRYAIAIMGGGLPIVDYIPAGCGGSSAHGVGKSWFTQGKNLRSGSDPNVKTLSNYNTTLVNNVYVYSNPVTGDKDGNASERLAQLLDDGRFYPGHIVPFSDDSSALPMGNYFDGTNDAIGGEQGPFQTLFNHDGLDFLNDTLQNAYGGNDIINHHDHDQTFSIQYDGTNLDVSQSIQVKCSPNVVPDDIPGALQITFTTRVASLTMVNLIRAY